VSTAVANAFLNNMNQITPQGNLSYDQTSTFDFTDPTTGNTYNIPRFTVTQSLSPQQQATLDQTNAAKYNLATIGDYESGMLGQFLPQNFNPIDTAPGGGNASALAQSLINQGVKYDYNQRDPTFDIGNAGPIQTTYGDQSGVLQDRANVENALFQRIRPQQDLDLSNLESRLADQGIRYGSDAYNNAMRTYQQGVNDSRLAVTAAGGQEQNLQEQIAQNRAQFGNQAQQQLYQQLLGAGNFQNQAAAQYNQQNATAAAAYNNAAQQYMTQQQMIYDAANQQRQQYLNEQYAARNQPINEVSALLTGGQLQNPNFINTPQNRIPTTDIASLINNNFQQNLDLYKQQSTNFNQLVGGLIGAAGIAGGAALKSDRRSKENISKIGSVMTAMPQKVQEPKELPIYQYSYKDDPASVQHIGPMAQDVERIDPRAVTKDKRGTKYIDTRRVMGGILRAA